MNTDINMDKDFGLPQYNYYHTVGWIGPTDDQTGSAFGDNYLLALD